MRFVVRKITFLFKHLFKIFIFSKKYIIKYFGRLIYIKGKTFLLKWSNYNILVTDKAIPSKNNAVWFFTLSAKLFRIRELYFYSAHFRPKPTGIYHFFVIKVKF